LPGVGIYWNLTLQRKYIRIFRSRLIFVKTGYNRRIIITRTPFTSRVFTVKKDNRLFWDGLRAVLPLAIGVIPFGMIYGALALSAGIPRMPAQAMSAVVFAGSAQFITAQLVGNATPYLIILVTIVIVNLRHVLYSASLAPYIRRLSPFWKISLAYFLTDEAYAVTAIHYDREGDGPGKQWFFLGAGLGLWISWQLSTAAGIFVGTVIPESWSLDFT
jgi:4-azaleucine resistance transporter AzlC